MNPKILAASTAALLVAAGMFVYLGAGLAPAEAIHPAAAEAGFAGQERREVEPWMPAPGMGTLADASIDALHEISVGASPSEALKTASSSRSLALNGQLEDMFGPEAVENCELKYWFMTDSFVNACSPYESFFGGAGAPGLPPAWGWVFQGNVLGYGSSYVTQANQYPGAPPGLVWAYRTDSSVVGTFDLGLTFDPAAPIGLDALLGFSGQLDIQPMSGSKVTYALSEGTAWAWDSTSCTGSCTMRSGWSSAPGEFAPGVTGGIVHLRGPAGEGVNLYFSTPEGIVPAVGTKAG